MKTARLLVIALLSYAAMLAPTASQAASIEVPVPGGHVRLPAPPMPPAPVVVIRGERGPDVYDREPRHYDREPRHYDHHDRRYYREERRHHRHGRRHDRDYRY